MGLREYNNFLLRCAEIINKASFERRNKRFLLRKIKYVKKLKDKFEQKLTKAKDTAKLNQSLRFSDNDAIPPKRGMIPETYYVLEDPPKGWWREKELPFNPDGYFAKFGSSVFVRPPTVEPNSREKFACNCALWAIIHDEMLSLSNRLWSKEDDWTGLIWESVKGVLNIEDGNKLHQRESDLKAVFDDVIDKLPVKRELPKEQPSSSIVVVREREVVVEKNIKPVSAPQVNNDIGQQVENQQASQNQNRVEQKVKPVKKPTRAEKKAWDSYEWVLDDRPKLLPTEAERWYSQEMYEHLKENGPFYNNHPKTPSPTPGYSSWARQLRRYEQWRCSCKNKQPTICDQPKTAVRRQDVQDEDLSKLSSRFESDNPG